MTTDDINFIYFFEHCNVEFVSTFFVCSVMFLCFLFIYGCVRFIVYLVRTFNSYFLIRKKLIVR